MAQPAWNQDIIMVFEVSVGLVRLALKPDLPHDH